MKTQAHTASIWAEDPGTGKRRDLTYEEHRGVLGLGGGGSAALTGIRIEELTELTHHSLVQYRLPTTGELVPLLQIAPSKTDTERLLLVSPELADVLSAIIIPDPRHPAGTCRWPSPTTPRARLQPADAAAVPATVPRLREPGSQPDPAARSCSTSALAATGVTDAGGHPLRYTFHDFRRILSA